MTTTNEAVKPEHRVRVYRHVKSGNLYQANVWNGVVSWGYRLKPDGSTTGRLQHVDGSNYTLISEEIRN
jgi:hypothetical protein